MTIWLTENPETTRAFLPPGTGWRPLERSARQGEVDERCQLFLGDKPVWWAGDLSAGGRAILLVDHAPTSQFDEALASLKRGGTLPDGLIALALSGERFRGQRQRPWTALRGNLHLTAHYHLRVEAAAAQAAATMIPAVAAAEAIERVSDHRLAPAIKWVNDVWLDQAKVAGVLTATGVSGPVMDRVTYGIGINVAECPEIIPSPFVPRAACLADFDPPLRGALPALLDVLVPLLDALVDLLRAGGYGEIFERYRARAGYLGQDVRIWPEGTEDWRTADPVVSGKVRAINPDLSLMIDGHGPPVRSGRLAYETCCAQVRPGDKSIDRTAPTWQR